MSDLNAHRRALYAQAVAAAKGSRGFYRLTLPTGAGKTLISLALSLAHAKHNGQRRVIYAVPFTTIIEQTAAQFRTILGEENVLEHYSTLDLDELELLDDEEAESSQQDWLMLAVENWDAPVVLSTTVQLFESLHANRTSKLRKLHNISGSVIVLDEAQSLPVRMLAPILESLRELVDHYKVSVIFCTATQPAFDDFPGLENVPEIIPDSAEVFGRAVFQRVKYDLRLDQPMTWEAVSGELRSETQALCIVNTRKDAKTLFDALREEEGTYHLSTNMCPKHRRRVLKEICARLDDECELPCRVISTQLIESGVDISFPVVYRAVGPLEAIVQAAGRCNRDGELGAFGGRVVVFVPADHKLPRGDYGARAIIAAEFLKEGASLDDLETFRQYFRRVYKQVETEPSATWEEGGKQYSKKIGVLTEEMNFEQVARAFQMIPDPTVNLLIRDYDRSEVDELLCTITDPTKTNTSKERQNRAKKVRRAWRKLGQYIVSVPRYQLDNPEFAHFTQVVPELADKARRLKQKVPDQLEWTGCYDSQVGLVQDYVYERYFGL